MSKLLVLLSFLILFTSCSKKNQNNNEVMEKDDSIVVNNKESNKKIVIKKEIEKIIKYSKLSYRNGYYFNPDEEEERGYTGKAEYYMEENEGVFHNDIYNYKNGRKDGKQFGRYDEYITLEGMLKKYEIYYKNGKRDGKSIGWYTNTKKRYEGEFKDDLPVGNWTFYFKDGKSEIKDMSKLSKKDDNKLLTWFRTGKKKQEVGLKDAKKDGKETIWYINENIASETNYKNGELDGLKTEYNRRGVKKYEYFYKSGSREKMIFWYQYYLSNDLKPVKKSEITFKNSKKTGLLTKWHINGKKMSEEKYKNDKKIGNTKYWDEDGKEVEKAILGASSWEKTIGHTHSYGILYTYSYYKNSKKYREVSYKSTLNNIVVKEYDKLIK